VLNLGDYLFCPLTLNGAINRNKRTRVGKTTKNIGKEKKREKPEPTNLLNFTSHLAGVCSWGGVVGSESAVFRILP